MKSDGQKTRLFQSWPLRAQLRMAGWAYACLLATVAVFAHAQVQAADQFKPFKLKTVNGEQRTLQHFSAKAILVTFFFPSCVYCNAEFPSVQQLYDKYKDQGLSAVWINMLPSENKLIVDWLEKHNYTIPVLIGASQASLMRDYKVKMTPMHYLLDSQGNIRYARGGYEKGDEVELEQQIQKALGTSP
jgi:peroxiredoxin